MHSATNSNTFLAYFNHIDAFLEVVLGNEEHIPFNEKIEKIAAGRYPVSNFIRKYQHKLKYFSDLRNQLVHGYRLDEHHYLLASDYAVQQIRTLQEALLKPPEVRTLFTRELPTCTPQTAVELAVQQMQLHRLRYLPVYDGQDQFLTILSERMIARSVRSEKTLHVQDVLSDAAGELYLFMKATTSTYEVEEAFAKQREEDKELAIIFLTASGTPADPLIGYITAADLPKLAEEVIL